MSESPRNPTRPVGPFELAGIERAARGRCSYATAQRRAAIAVGCDPDLALTVTQLCALTLNDITFSDKGAVIAAADDTRDVIEIAARPDDPACPVAALRSLRGVARHRMRTERGDTAPSKAELRRQRLFIDQYSGAPLTSAGLRCVVNRACAGLPGVPSPAPGRLAALSVEQRRQAIAAGCDPKTARNLALLFHAAFSALRAGDIENLSVDDVAICGDSTRTPLVDGVAPDGTVIEGILDRVGTITDTDILDTAGVSLYGSGLIQGVCCTFARTSRGAYGQVWYPAQPGHPACPVRLLLMWLKCYDQMLVANEGARLAGHHPLFTSLKNVGEPIAAMTRTLGRIVREAMASIGIPPDRYNAHSLRTFRATAVFDRGGSWPDVMVHDGRSSGADGVPYARRATAGQLQRRTRNWRRLRGLFGFQRLRGVYEPPDVVGAQRFRDEYRRVAPNLSEAELAYDVNLYERRMSPATRRSYEAVLRPFYLAAARAGFNPLTCDPAELEAHILNLMRAGKVGADGNRDPNKPYSPGYFKMFLAAHRCATEAKGLPDITGLVDLKKLLRGYNLWVPNIGTVRNFV